MSADLALALWGSGAVVALIAAAWLAGQAIVAIWGGRRREQPRPIARGDEVRRRQIREGMVECPRYGWTFDARLCDGCEWLRSKETAPELGVVCGPPLAGQS